MDMRLRTGWEGMQGGRGRVQAVVTLNAKVRQFAEVLICIIFSKYNVFPVSNLS